MSAQSFQCPNCGGQIPLTGGTEKSVKCPYCNNTIIVPKELRATAVMPAAQPYQPQVYINTTPAPEISSDAVKKGALAIGGFTLASVLLPLIITCVIMVFVGGVIMYTTSSITSSVKSALGDTSSSGSDSSSGISGLVKAVSGPGTVTLQFGSEGSGPGQFKDARHIGVDADGTIYVGQYIGGRIQVFDPKGQYKTEWTVDHKMPLTGFAVSRKGIVYTAQSGQIALHDGQTGEVTGSLTYAEGDWFDTIWLQPNNTLVASWYDNSDDIVVFNPQGKTTTVVKKAISTVADDAELDTTVAADGEGNIYALGSFTNAVYKFSPSGAFQDKFGAEGDGQGQFRAPLALAVDPQGQVYVADFKGVQIFGADGQYKGLIDVNGPAYGLCIDPSGHLWVVSGTQVTEYTVNIQ